MFDLEDFGSFAPIRMEHKPKEATTVSLLFVRFACDKKSIHVLFGYEKDAKEDVSVSEISSSETRYINKMTFDAKLVRELQPKSSGIETLDQLMDKVPQFCENLRFKKLIWEEMHSIVTHKRKRPQIRV